jgi:hypothetical protein
MTDTQTVSATDLSERQWAQLIRAAAQTDAQRGGRRAWSERYAVLLTRKVSGLDCRVLAALLRQARAALHHTQDADGVTDRPWAEWFGRFLVERIAELRSA